MPCLIERLESRVLLSNSLPGLVPIHAREAAIKADLKVLKAIAKVDAKALQADVKRLQTAKADKPLLKSVADAEKATHAGLQRDIRSITALINKGIHELLALAIKGFKAQNN